MAQLRDAETSEIIAEGTPFELVTIAGEIGDDEVVYDDVGEAFDPDAVRKAHDEDLAGLDSAAAEADADAAKAKNADERKSRKADADRLRERVREIKKERDAAAKRTQKARDAMGAARERRDDRRKRDRG